MAEAKQEISNFKEAAEQAKLLKKIEDQIFVHSSDLEKDIKVLQDEFDAKVSALQNEYTVLAGPLEASRDTIKTMFEAYHEKIIAENPDRKTLNFRFGKTRLILKRRIQQPEIIREKKDVSAIAQLKLIPALKSFIKIEEGLDWAKLKKQSTIDATAGTVRIVDESNKIDIVLKGFKVEAKPASHSLSFETIEDARANTTPDSYKVVDVAEYIDYDTMPVTITSSNSDDDANAGEDILAEYF